MEVRWDVLGDEEELVESLSDGSQTQDDHHAETPVRSHP